MSEILKAAFARPRAINQNKHHFLVNKGLIPQYIWDFYPLATDYYHEFNPYYVHLIYNEKIFPEFPVFTVRDGVVAFADFLLKNLKLIPTWKTLFLIPASYAPLVPDVLREQFLTYTISQNQKPDIRKANTVTIFGLMCEQYFGNYDKIAEKLAVLKDLAPDAEIRICLAPRKNPLDPGDKETLHYIHVPELVRKSVGEREIKWMKTRDLMDNSIYRDHYLLDLLDGNFLTCDSYFHFWFLSRGGMVNSIPEWDKKETLFDLDISFHHKLHVRPLPEVKSQFGELLFFSKMFKGDFVTSPKFHNEVLRIISTKALRE